MGILQTRGRAIIFFTYFVTIGTKNKGQKGERKQVFFFNNIILQQNCYFVVIYIN
jgi:hypothetical protein